MTDREYDPNLEDERVEPVDEEPPAPPPTVDPDERLESDEVAAVDPDRAGLDDERPV